MTDPAVVPRFLAETKVDMLAVTIGNVHGKYARPPQLDFRRLAAIRDGAEKAGREVKLVLHGASGLPHEQVQQAMTLGVCKFNVNTDLREAAIKVLTQSLLSDSGKGADILPLMKQTTKAMTDVMMGPDFWVRNMDISVVRAEIASFSKQETKVQITMEEFEQVSLNRDELLEGPLRRLWRKRTLQGFLLPFFLLKGRNKILCITNLQIDIKKSFRFRRVLFSFPPSHSGYIVTHQKVRFFVEFLRFYRAYYRLIWQYKDMQRAYEEALPRLTNEAFWRGVYREEMDCQAAKVNGQ
jgi:hypothetical protein